MAVFSAIAAAVSTYIASITLASVAIAAAKMVLLIGISKLIADRRTKGQGNNQNSAGARVQLPPATNNKLPVVYGRAFIAPVITDAKLSIDQKTMLYCCALSEVTDSGIINFGKIYWGGKQLNFDNNDLTRVVSMTNNAGETDNRCNGSLFVYLYRNGSYQPVNTTSSAVDIMSSQDIPEQHRWTGNHNMFKTSFIIFKVVYNQTAGLTGLDQINVELINSLDQPGSVLLDYFTNARYGCAVPINSIDVVSLDLLNQYSDQLINFTLAGSTNQQARYRINGPIDTGQDCLSNLQYIADCCDSWIQYSEINAKWRVIINMPADISNSFKIDSSNLVSGIDVSPIDLNNTYNSIEVQYPNYNIKDQMAYAHLKLIDYLPELMSPNEPNNQLVVSLPYCNNAVQAQYIGIRRLLQSREDLTIQCALDYSGIILEAGDVVKVTHAEFGWVDKLFRISQVQEFKTDSGILGARIQAFEYNSYVYSDHALEDFIPAPNTGLKDPNIISAPTQLTVTTSSLSSGNIASFEVSVLTPEFGSVLYLDFNFGLTPDVSEHKLYRTVSTGNGIPYAPLTLVKITINDLPPNQYYFSVLARNNSSGRQGASSGAYNWNGMNVTSYNPSLNQGGISSQQLQYNSVNTFNVVPNSINLPGSAYTSGVIFVPFNAWASVQETTLTTSGAPIHITGSLGWYTTNDYGTDQAIEVRISRYLGAQQNTIYQGASSLPAGTQAGAGALITWTGVIADQPTSGTYQYKLEVYKPGSNGSTFIQYRSLVLQEIKR